MLFRSVLLRFPSFQGQKPSLEQGDLSGGGWLPLWRASAAPAPLTTWLLGALGTFKAQGLLILKQKTCKPRLVNNSKWHNLVWGLQWPRSRDLGLRELTAEKGYRWAASIGPMRAWCAEGSPCSPGKGGHFQPRAQREPGLEKQTGVHQASLEHGEVWKGIEGGCSRQRKKCGKVQEWDNLVGAAGNLRPRCDPMWEWRVQWKLVFL